MTSNAVPSFSLSGRRALVTGAGRGLGRAVALAYATAGAEVTLCARTEADIEEAAAEIRATDGKAKTMALDVTDVPAFSAAVAKEKPFNIFFNNAGTNRPKPQLEITEEDYDFVMNLNVRAAYFAAQAVSRAMIEGGVKNGSIINMSSQMGHVGAANRSLYCASKWAVEGFSKSLAIELGPHGIRVNTICPTFIETPLTKSYFEDAEFLESVLSKIKLGRLGQLSDITGAAIFLASDAAALMTGSALMLDGGWTAD